MSLFAKQVSRIEKVGGASSKGENSYGIEVFCKVSFFFKERDKIITILKLKLISKYYCYFPGYA